ncbi:MAG: DUF305 domain-containing protein [Solirubrobacterales bacterium]|nr:DUF305 domain-containing protein [Solirubrobacterales bacterium]
MNTRKLATAGAAVLAVAVGLAIVLGGGGDGAEVDDIDGAFIVEMVAHHEMAVEMAEMAQAQAGHPQIQRLAAEIIAAQQGEIEELESIHERLYEEPAGEVDFASLPISEGDAGMNMDMEMLMSAEPFDREFIDMMIPHHRGAIRMARLELDQGSDPEARQLAKGIIAAQSREIVEMNQWRMQWYGEPSPAGSIPPEDG